MSMFRDYKDFQRTPSKNHRPVKQDSYKCEICDEGQWMSETEVDIHRKIYHTHELSDIVTNKKRYGCAICIRSQKSKEALYEHIKTEHLLSSRNAERIERQIYICHHCSRIFFNKILLSVHIAQKHKFHISKAMLVDCPKCLKPLNKKTLWHHLEYHHLSSVSTCPICVEKCANRNELRKHLDTHRKYLFCDTCHYSTRYQDKFHEHIAKHRKLNPDADVKLHKYFVPMKGLMKRTKLTVYSPIKGLLLPRNMRVCVVCRQICLNTIDMTEHLTLDHTPEEGTKKKCYTCEVCDMEFSNNILLKQHMFKENRVLDHHGIVEVPPAPSEEIVIYSNNEGT